MLKTNRVDVFPRNITCLDENGSLVFVDNETLENIQKICNRPIVINIAMIAATQSAIVAVVVVINVKRVMKRRKIVRKLIEGEGQFECAVFLSCSKENGEFAESCFHEELNTSLKTVIKLEQDSKRDLVFVNNLKPGLSLSEVTNYLPRSAVLVVVLSEDCCTNRTCEHEFTINQAFDQNKPVFFMVESSIDVQMIDSTIQNIYKFSEKFFWREENGNILTIPSWEDTARAIVDKMNV